MLETQISQVAQQQAASVVPSGSFLGKPEQNPKEHLNVVTTRSGKEVVEEVEKESPYVVPPPYKLIVPFPQRLVKSKVEAQFKKFVELLKNIHPSVPFTEALTQMPSYAKFLKEILSNKRNPEDNEIVAMTIDISVVIQNMVIPKLQDQGGFSILFHISTMDFDRDLWDLRVIVSLMLLSVCKKLDTGDMRPTNMSLNLYDKSVKLPIGVLEDIPMRVGEYFFSGRLYDNGHRWKWLNPYNSRKALPSYGGGHHKC
ncbi:uncharacterized protein LOC127138196 [Lathyrus oleraceus]|uniref:uncharacterized protein LOC127138196 n=1 Tax=Pisum sativum TaxID=3888 RepID=UPI0021D0F65A|nr:uncharacterized protein LOC127138196 [Pisum sativum]